MFLYGSVEIENGAKEKFKVNGQRVKLYWENALEEPKEKNVMVSVEVLPVCAKSAAKRDFATRKGILLNRPVIHERLIQVSTLEGTTIPAIVKARR
ncbi:hypothetical protein QYF36_023459 [Acer negundo]|nr:hypothetical protein QYF36_023459 [Acer negundo]